MDAVRSLLRWLPIGASALVMLGFVFFVTDEAQDGSSGQVARVSDSTGKAAPVPAQAPPEKDKGAVRTFVEDANDKLLAPFANVVSSDEAWVEHGVPALLALLVYGMGGMMLLNYALPRRR